MKFTLLCLKIFDNLLKNNEMKKYLLVMTTLWVSCHTIDDTIPEPITEILEVQIQPDSVYPGDLVHYKVIIKDSTRDDLKYNWSLEEDVTTFEPEVSYEAPSQSGTYIYFIAIGLKDKSSEPVTSTIRLTVN